jgi:hypothetical protein
MQVVARMPHEDAAKMDVLRRMNGCLTSRATEAHMRTAALPKAERRGRLILICDQTMTACPM